MWSFFYKSCSCLSLFSLPYKHFFIHVRVDNIKTYMIPAVTATLCWSILIATLSVQNSKTCTYWLQQPGTQITYQRTLMIKFANFSKTLLFKLIWIGALYAVFLMRKIMYLQTCGSLKSAKNHKKIGSASRKSANPTFILRRPANLTIYLSSLIGGFAICWTYLRTTHLCSYMTWTRSLPNFFIYGENVPPNFPWD